MHQSELQPAATIAMVEQGATARPIFHTKRRVIFPTFDSKSHNNKVTTTNSGNGHPAEIAVPNQALELPATGHVECPKKVSTCPLLLPLLGGPPHPASCANTSPRGMPCLLEPESTKPSVVSSHRAGSMLRGPSVVRPDPARRSVLFVSTAETERIPSLPFPPSKIIQNIICNLFIWHYYFYLAWRKNVYNLINFARALIFFLASTPTRYSLQLIFRLLVE